MSRVYNILETFNELVVLTIGYLTLVFTETDLSVETRGTVGVWTIVLILTIITFNGVYWAYLSIRAAYLSIKDCYIERKLKKCDKKKKKDLDSKRKKEFIQTLSSLQSHHQS